MRRLQLQMQEGLARLPVLVPVRLDPRLHVFAGVRARAVVLDVQVGDDEEQRVILLDGGAHVLRHQIIVPVRGQGLVREILLALVTVLVGGMLFVAMERAGRAEG